MPIPSCVAPLLHPNDSDCSAMSVSGLYVRLVRRPSASATRGLCDVAHCGDCRSFDVLHSAACTIALVRHILYLCIYTGEHKIRLPRGTGANVQGSSDKQWGDSFPVNMELVQQCLAFSNKDDVESGKSCLFITFHVNMALICISSPLRYLL